MYSVNRAIPRLSAATVVLVAPLLAPAARAQAPSAAPPRVASPDGRNVVTVELQNGVLTYALARDGRPLLLPSRLGFAFRGAPTLGAGAAAGGGRASSRPPSMV